MIQDHFLPIAKKLRENAMIVDQKEKQMILHKHTQQQSEDDSDYEADVQEVREQIVAVEACRPIPNT